MEYIKKETMTELLSETKLFGTRIATLSEGALGNITRYDMGSGNERRITLSTDMVIYERFEGDTLKEELYTYLEDHSDTAAQNRTSPVKKPQREHKGKGSNKDKRPKW